MSYSHARRIPDHAVFVHVIFHIHWETKRGTCFILQMVRFRFHLLDDPPVYFRNPFVITFLHGIK